MGYTRLVTEYNYIDNDWLKKLYKSTKYWCPAFSKDYFSGGILSYKGWNQLIVQFFGDLMQLLAYANFIRISLMLLLNGGVRRMDMTMTLGTEGRKHILWMWAYWIMQQRYTLLNFIIFFKESTKKKQLVPKRRFKRPIHIWSIKCGETMLLNFAMLSTLISQLKKLL